MSDEFDELDAIARAMARINVSEEDEITVKLYRKVGGVGRQAKEYVCSFDYVPNEETIKKFGAGAYQLRFESGDKSTFADVRIADLSGVPLQGEPLPQIMTFNNPMDQLKQSLNVLREFKDMFSDFFPVAPVAPVSNRTSTEEIADALAGQNRVMMRTIMNMNKQHQEHIAEIYASLEDMEEEPMGQEVSVYDAGEEISEEDIQAISGLCSQLLGAGGGAIASMVCQLPQVKKYRDNISVIRKVFDGTGLDRDSMIKVGRMLKVPDSVLGML